MISEFLQEADDELSQVDEILLGAQQDALTKEQIDAIFRIFHTIKGVAGFLELEDVCVLAHATEHLLDGARVGRLRIEGDNLDLVFRATEDMRARLDRLKATAPSGYSFATLGALRALLHQISDVADPSHEEQSDALTALRTSSAVGGRSEQAAPVRATANPGGGTQARIKEFVKVDLERVDNFVTLVGELVIVESMIANAPELRHNLSPWLRAQLTQMSKITRDLQDIGTRMRMVPIRSVFQKMARMVRNLCQRSDKEVAVHITGEGTEIDRSMVEQVSSPLVHMIRNAVDHGIETPNERRACGKDPCGTIRLRASHQGGSVVIEVSDDGRG
ncbi:MAG: chemotaxis protein CheA, partial [Polyangiales bacterium]